MPDDKFITNITATKPDAENIAALRVRSLEINERIKSLGADRFDMLLPETHALPYVIHPHETILGIVYGRYKQDGGSVIGRGALIATDSRAMLIDKKPLFVRSDEVAYGAVSGVTYGRIGIMGVVTLHSKIGDIRLRTFNQKCAKSFVEAVEAQIFNATEV